MRVASHLPMSRAFTKEDADGPEPRFQLGARLRTVLLEDSLGAVAR